ncbi:AAA family ATPase, partial [Actinomycetospora chlora]|uniref:AAA family ATPase n=1 Tax=Actinomycetospora chlora TaxID=663608 RepID=UPI0031F03955
MSLPDALRALRERRRVVLVAVLVALLAGGALYLLRPPTYTATLTVYAAPRPTDPATTTADAAYQANLLAKERVPSYVQLATSPQVVSQVIGRARLDTSVTDLTSRTVATTVPDSVLIDIAVQAPSAQQAVAIADAFSQVLPPAVDQLEQGGAPGVPAVSLRVIRPIPVPDRPTTPGLGLTLGLALLAGLVIGVAVALIRAAADRSVRDTGALAAAVGLPVLGSLPVRPSRGDPGPEPERSELGEAYRQLRTALHGAATSGRRHGAPGVLVVASPGAGDGRTTTVVNLGVAAAGAGMSVLVLDADLRAPRAARALSADGGTGLTDVLSGAAEPEDVIRRSPLGPDVLAPGPLPSNPAELLAGEALAEVLEELRERYALVVVDTPPLLPVTDAAVLGAAADGVTVLARRGRTTGDDLAAVLRSLETAGGRAVGTVLVADPDHRPALADDGGRRSPMAPRRAAAARRPEPEPVPAPREV